MKCVAGLIVASLGVATFGCASTGPSREQLHAQVEAYRRAIIERDQRLAYLTYQFGALARGQAVLTAQLDQARRAERQVTQKLEELMALNDRIEARLQKAEHRLEEGEGAASAARREGEPSHLEQERTELLRQLRGTQTARNEAMKELARTVQYLVDTGQLQTTRGDGGSGSAAPRTLDVEDPWRYR